MVRAVLYLSVGGEIGKRLGDWAMMMFECHYR